jgi:hypothetical protein
LWSAATISTIHQILNLVILRIVLKKKNSEHWLLAVADTQETIDKHWDYLVNELLPQAKQIEEDETAVIQYDVYHDSSMNILNGVFHSFLCVGLF